MNVLLLTTHLNPGGIGIYTLSLACALKKSGIDVIVSSSGGELVDDLHTAGIDHVRIPVNTSADIGLHTILSCSILGGIMRDRNIDIVHAQTRVTQVIAYFLTKRRKACFVSTCHGFFKMKFFRKILPCWGVCTIAISHAVRQHLACDMGVSKDRIALIHNGIDISRFNPCISADEKAAVKKQYSLGKGPVIGIVSRLSKVKGHKYLLKAFARVQKSIPDSQLLIIGSGPRRYAEELKSLSKKLGIAEMSRFYPACRDVSVPLSAIDVFCQPSLQEGLGLSILEAMAMGIPVVASDVGGIHALIKHRLNGFLVPSMDEKALADAIIEILSDPVTARSMGAESRKIAERDFTLEAMCDRVIGVYDMAMKGFCEK